MALHRIETLTFRGPHSAEYELRKAYNCIIEMKVLLLRAKHPIKTINIKQVSSPYLLAYQRYQEGKHLASERWARACKHLARAFWYELIIDYLETRTGELPYLEGARKDEYGLGEQSDTTADLLEAVIAHPPPGLREIPTDMMFYYLRGKKLLENLKLPQFQHELLRAEIIKSTYEYARVLECMNLAYEAEYQNKTAA